MKLENASQKHKKALRLQANHGKAFSRAAPPKPLRKPMVYCCFRGLS